MTLATLLVLSCATLALGQRPFFAGSKPIGYPEVTTEGLGDRFGEVDGTTQRLPIEANGDRELVDRLSKLPIDKQPFWLINWQALEANRQKPQTYPQKPNPFVDPITGNIGLNSVPASESSGNPTSGSASPNTNAVGSGFVNNNRFGGPAPSGNSAGSGTFGSSGSSGTSSSNVNYYADYGYVKPNRYSAEEYPRKDGGYNSSDKKKV